MHYAMYGMLENMQQMTVGSFETDFVVGGSQTPLHFRTGTPAVRQKVRHSVAVSSISSMGHHDHLDLYETSITEISNC
jgi:hypothetical protein